MACLFPTGSLPVSVSLYNAATGLLGTASSPTGGLFSLYVDVPTGTPHWVLVDGERAGTPYDLWVDVRTRLRDDSYERNNGLDSACLPHPLWRGIPLSQLSGLARDWNED